ncbi:hypothetical protein Patl1_20735 [Pistacia atlantica]|uniref:Uncharacterized protein n=1 Tax=Pistacia atlantica TaxID=434234 RepID=A0ACC1BJR0_9ROSI|nr:hypothetical protein Patl1_20735 [Pistacia atlantica]
MFAFREKIPIEAEGFFKQQGAGSTIQSNDIERFSHLFSRNKWAISLQNCASLKFQCASSLWLSYFQYFSCNFYHDSHSNVESRSYLF